MLFSGYKVLLHKISSRPLLYSTVPTVNDRVLCTSNCVNRLDLLLTYSYQRGQNTQKSARTFLEVMDMFSTLAVVRVCIYPSSSKYIHEMCTIFVYYISVKL